MPRRSSRTGRFKSTAHKAKHGAKVRTDPRTKRGRKNIGTAAKIAAMLAL